ncbi:hypothetical protein QWY16_13515 [Planococcus shenhongbingii]|uniref:hypothetical protein n=1 Tax=Planococcus shenhongbingii TaxID=3058398 RepID=UPI0026055E87|nr:hypothetical protein [Planococcus sp. N016]WKA57513.1 hypothetical protein QWY16_13515 [Planococcus sp. N016]
MFKRLMSLSIFACVLFLFFLPLTSLAAPEMTIKADAGLQNKVKYDKGLPVQFTLSNGGSDFSGDLVLSYSETYSLGAGLSVPVELAAGETKTIQVAVPGLSDMMSMGGPSIQTIFLYEGGWEDGKSINFKGSKTLSPGFFSPSSLFIATLTNNSDRLLQLDQISPAGSESTQIFHLNQMNQFSLPTEALAWETVDYLLVDEFSYGDLPEAVQQAVLQWIQQGGHVVVGSTENISAAMGNLSEFLPLELGAPSEAMIPSLETPVPVFEATLKEGAVPLIEQKGEVLAASMQVGSGTITQTSFSLGDEPVTSQKAYVDLASRFFPPVSGPNMMNQGESIKEMMTYEVGQVNELFESFAVSKTLIMGIVLIYIILIIPVLYMILKKKDKREYAWIIIPAAALVTSIGLFAIGAKDRIANPQIQQTGFFEVDQDGGLNGYYMNTLLSNRGGDYRFAAPSSTTMTYLLDTQFSENPLQQSAILEQQATGSNLTMRDMRYWSVGSVLGESYIENTGNFAVDLAVEDQTISGTIQNNFPFAIEDVSIWTGTRLMAMGDLSPGEQLEVNQPVQSDILPAASPIGSTYAYQPIANKEELKKARKQTILSMSYNQLESNESSPYVIAYTNNAIVPITLEKQRASVSAVHLIAQPFKPDMNLKGEISLNADTFSLEVNGVNGSSYFENVPPDPYLYYMDNGKYEVAYRITDAVDLKKTTWKELMVTAAKQNIGLSIYNMKTGKTEEITNNQQAITEAVSDYISPEGHIKFVVETSSANSQPEVTLPKIKLKGVVAP